MYYTTIQTMMRPSSTIEAMIRFHNDISLNKEQLKQLVEAFNKHNPDAQPPRPYQQVQMPVLMEYVKNEESTTHKYRLGE